MIVYAVENTVNNKLYIGATKHDLRTRFTQHVRAAKRGSDFAFHCAIRKHGEDAFQPAILTHASSEKEMYELEIECIGVFDTFEGRGYNMTPGGEGGPGDLKLTQEDVLEIRTRYASNQGVTLKKLARDFGVDPGTISVIVSGVTRTDVGGPIIEDSNSKKLTEAEVVEIRKKYASGDATYNDLATEYNINKTNVGFIVRGESWQDAGGPIAEKSDPSKLAEAEVVEIRKKYATGNVSQVDLAEEYNVGTTTVSQIVRGKRFPDAGGPISEENGGKKLAKEKVVKIREEYAVGSVSQADLAEEHNVTPQTIRKIVRGKTYPDAGGPIAEKQSREHRSSSLVEKEVIEIREKYASGGFTYNDLATEYNISIANVGLIVQGKSWPDVGGPIKGEDYS